MALFGFIEDFDSYKEVILKHAALVNEKRWASLLESHNFTILYKGYFGGFQFWKGPEKMNSFKQKCFGSWHAS